MNNISVFVGRAKKAVPALKELYEEATMDVPKIYVTEIDSSVVEYARKMKVLNIFLEQYPILPHERELLHDILKLPDTDISVLTASWAIERILK